MIVALSKSSKQKETALCGFFNLSASNVKQ